MLDPMYAAWGEALAPWLWPAAAAAAVALATGFVLAFWLGRRRFNRRNSFAVEEFNGFAYAVGTRLVEGIGWFVVSALVLVGMLAFLVALGAAMFGSYR